MADSQQQPADAEGGPAVWLLRSVVQQFARESLSPGNVGGAVDEVYRQAFQAASRLPEPWATQLTKALTGLDRPALAADLSRRALALVEPLLQAPKE
jgi:hypothetical protein